MSMTNLRRGLILPHKKKEDKKSLIQVRDKGMCMCPETYPAEAFLFVMCYQKNTLIQNQYEGGKTDRLLYATQKFVFEIQ